MKNFTLTAALVLLVTTDYKGGSKAVILIGKR